MTPCIRALALLTTASSLALAQPPQSRPAVVHRYPAASRAPERWVAASAPIVIGAGRDDGPFLFVDIVAAFLMGSDRVIVADGKTSEFRLFSFPDGRHLRSFGGPGQGPGEIADLWNAWRTRTSIVAEDAEGKASVFTVDGKFSRVLPRGVDASGRRVERIGIFDDTLSLARMVDEVPAMQPGDSRLLQMQLLAVSSRGSRLITRYADRTLTRGAAGRPREPVFSARAVSAVVGERVCVGFPARYVIDCYAPTGQHLTHVERVNARAWPVTVTHREDFIASESTANVGPNGAAYVAQLRSTVPYAPTLPLFGEFVGATNGDLWVGPYVPVGPVPMKRIFPRVPTTWSVYGVDGRWKADVTLPARFQLMSVDGMRVIGVLRDEDDVESVVVIGLRKG
jgi:hypothetical protein